jgi:hypothetical protein
MKKLIVPSLLCLGLGLSTQAGFAQCSVTGAVSQVNWNLSRAVGPNVTASVTHKLISGCNAINPNQMHIDLITTSTACAERVTFTYSDGSQTATNYYYLSAPAHSADHLDQSFSSPLALGNELYPASSATSFSVSFGGSCPGSYQAITFPAGFDSD